jgi:hypothetical protein
MSIRAEINPETGRKWVNLTGHVFGRWTVLECTGRSGELTGKPHGQTMWKCRCECGKVKERVNYGALIGRVSRSCGCLRGEVLGARAKKHGDSKAKAYVAWQGAQQRCFNPDVSSWNNYGGRGIKMCEGFRGSYPAWRDALGPPPSPEHSVDRRDNEGHYSCGLCPECVENKWVFNIHWATIGEQASNRRSVRRFKWAGKNLTITQIARMENVAFCSLRNRLLQDKMYVSDAVAELRKLGLTFNERAKFIKDADPSIVTRPPKHHRKPRKVVPNKVASCPE